MSRSTTKFLFTGELPSFVLLEWEEAGREGGSGNRKRWIGGIRRYGGKAASCASPSRAGQPWVRDGENMFVGRCLRFAFSLISW